ncbi:hypothetical protein [Acetobacterium bakii]|uniref:Desulfoferrodoxin ferrous iron-binding domain-containing protein n=1 Tax=Acetobacterium bakii TaxID=52689 RepID=A0A0L6U3Q7_9FIRM|nr:hypothetical protein [Acetobacterium bakii]KNZ43153.1 hypothetical protein AKG39_03130 [Acetobacterium bakii]
MQKQKFGVKRSRETTKPKVDCPEVIFYYCSCCGSVFQGTSVRNESIPICCDGAMDILEAKECLDFSAKILINYRIIGGYNENAIEVFWQIKEASAAPQWIYLKTFTGGQLKYVKNSEKSSFIFALADEDAYVYCNEDPCLECTFRCKRGFEIYVYLNKAGLIKLPMDRMQANW